jgi:inosine-uridine nucleoside N-ribohydrolase
MSTPLPVIFDSDMDTDCDDAGALATLLSLADDGKARVLACICNAPTPWGPPCMRRILDFYAATVPVASVLPRHPLSQPRYADYRQHLTMMAPHLYNEHLAHLPRPGEPLPLPFPPLNDAVATYRQVLANADDHSVVIIAVGLLTAIGDLLDSTADQHSPLNGMDLVARKVAKLVTMGGGSFPTGYDGFNWRMDRPAALRVLNDFPALLIVNELGSNVLTGATLSTVGDRENPVRLAYELFLGGAGRTRPSWDQVTVLAALSVVPASLEEVCGHSLEYLPSGEHRWVRHRSGPERRFMRQRASDDHLASEIDQLMTRAPRAR